MSETVTAGDMRAEYDDPWEAIADLKQENEDLKEELAEYQNHNEKDKAEIKKRVSNVEDGLETQSSNITGVHNRINDLKETVEESGLDASNPRGNSPETALEEKVTLSDDSLDNESANAIRAIKVAEAIHTGGTRPTGNYLRVERVGTGDDARYMAKSRNVKKALEGMGVPGHDTTVKRVMKKLAEMGGDRVEFEKRRGTNRVYFDIDLVNHIQSYSHRCEPGNTPTPSQTVSTTG